MTCPRLVPRKAGNSLTFCGCDAHLDLAAPTLSDRPVEHGRRVAVQVKLHGALSPPLVFFIFTSRFSFFVVFPLVSSQHRRQWHGDGRGSAIFVVDSQKGHVRHQRVGRDGMHGLVVVVGWGDSVPGGETLLGGEGGVYPPLCLYTRILLSLVWSYSFAEGSRSIIFAERNRDDI